MTYLGAPASRVPSPLRTGWVIRALRFGRFGGRAGAQRGRAVGTDHTDSGVGQVYDDSIANACGIMVLIT